MFFYLDSGGSATASGSSDTASPIATGSSNATCPANKTFASATDVNTGTDQVTVTGHGYSTGFGCQLTTSSALPGGLTGNVLYFLRAVDANTLTFHRTSADAQANTNIIDITSVGTGTQTIVNQTIVLGGSPDLSSLIGKGYHCRLTTTGTSHVFTFDDAHGFSDGDIIWPGGVANNTGGVGFVTATGLVADAFYVVKALTTTTTRLYQTVAQAITGGASPINVSGTVNDGHGHVRSNQQAIYLASSTVTTGQKIFRIRYVDNTNKFVIVGVNVTGLGAGSDWAIGGRATAARCVDICAIVGWTDVVVFNTDISGAINAAPVRFNGVGGFGKFVGKAGARRVWANTGNGALVTGTTGTNLNYWFENLELQSQGTGAIYNTGLFGSTQIFIDCRFTDAGASPAFGEGGGSNWAYFRCEFTGFSGIGLSQSGTWVDFYGCYAHDFPERLLTSGNASYQFVDNIIERLTGATSMVHFSSTSFNIAYFWNNTLYRSDAHGLSFTINSPIFFGVGNIFKDNGNAATEFGISSTNRGSFTSRQSAYDIEGGRGGLKYQSDFPIDGTDITDIDGGSGGFIDADNGTASLRDFTLHSDSPGYQQTYTLLNSATQITFSMGAVQPDFSEDSVMLNIANKRANHQ